MHINHYEMILNQFLGSRNNHPEEPGRKVPINTDQLPLGGIKVVDATVMVFDIANSSRALEKLGREKYVEWLGMALHCFFHCVDDYNGTIDKYTGDGAMVSFSFGTKEQRCINAEECAAKISQILYKILNPYFKYNHLKIMNVRVGLDFGAIHIEKLGKKGKSQLIIVGGAANCAKDLEQWGKQLKFNQYTTICFGYDLLYNLPKTYLTGTSGDDLYREIGHFKGFSEMDDSTPYYIYEYTGRWRD